MNVADEIWMKLETLQERPQKSKLCNSFTPSCLWFSSTCDQSDVIKNICNGGIKNIKRIL